MFRKLLTRVIVSSAVAYALWKFGGTKDAGDLREIISTIAAVSGTLMGFMVASLSVLTAVINRRLITNLRKTGHYDDLVTELYYTAVIYLITMVLAVSGLFLANKLLVYGVPVISGFMFMGTYCFVVAGRKFTIVMKLID